MRREEFADNAPGRLQHSIHGYLTFVPNPLPPQLTFDMPMISLLSDADRALGELAGVGQMLPNPHLLIRPFLRREAVLSNRIEGTVTRLDQIFLFEAQDDEVRRPDDVGEVINYVRALEYGLEQVRANRALTLRLLREIHAVLLQGVRGENKRPGEFRACPVVLGRSAQRVEDARFVPPCHTELEGVLRDFERFINVDRAFPAVVHLALAHYQFETIHPFMDGNGRLGRLLITLMLCERKVMPQPLLYLSGFFDQHDQEYRDLMLEVSRRAAWGEWIAFVARGIAEQGRDAADRAKRLLALNQVHRKRAADVSNSASTLQLADELLASPFITVKRASEILQVTFATAQNCVNRLVEAGILLEVSGKQRNRVYKAKEILAMLDAPPSGSESEAAGPEGATAPG